MKTCGICGTAKGFDEFHKKSAAKDGYSHKCKLCSKVYHAKWYQKNRDRVYKRTRMWQRENSKRHRAMILEYLRSHPCVDIRVSEPIVLTFDQVRGAKKANIAKLIRPQTSASWERIEREIAKCVVRCANCHARKTAKQFNWWKLDT
jgi:hypothetical protein